MLKVYLISSTDAIVLNGETFSLECDKIGSCIPQGDWYREDELDSIRQNISTLTIRNASFDDDGIFRCVYNRLNNSLLAVVYSEFIICTAACVLSTYYITCHIYCIHTEQYCTGVYNIPIISILR